MAIVTVAERGRTTWGVRGGMSTDSKVRAGDGGVTARCAWGTGAGDEGYGHTRGSRERSMGRLGVGDMICRMRTKGRELAVGEECWSGEESRRRPSRLYPFRQAFCAAPGLAVELTASPGQRRARMRQSLSSPQVRPEFGTYPFQGSRLQTYSTGSPVPGRMPTPSTSNNRLLSSGCAMARIGRRVRRRSPRDSDRDRPNKETFEYLLFLLILERSRLLTPLSLMLNEIRPPAHQSMPPRRVRFAPAIFS